ncbi:SDR family NAD(P)-dependent oxidoreductase [Janibacter melonis]|uniref:SDR family NAD(P)-dependent oxidoreductase n=2 Tax=Janibacter melonis TaxID=262209 RepID=A0A650GDI8_9MICO|nr:SDR family NAD(P)-dependent oxidoreductase [Janibacter melonis]QGX08276.1 SDR family NAD(P)-dependent oxidoreductase [Janibacter melonis]
MTLAPNPRHTPSLRGRRVLVTGGARGIGAALAELLAAHGAQVAVLGLEPALLEEVAGRCGGPWRECDVSDPVAVDDAVEGLVADLGGLDVVVANAGIARQLPVIGGQPGVMETHLAVNALGTFYTLRAAGPHISHERGYALATAALAAAIHLPLIGAYSASKAAVEAIGNTLRLEIRHTGARVGVAYYSEIDTEMTQRGFATETARLLTGGGTITGVTPLPTALRALERGIARRSRHVVAPPWLRPAVPGRAVAQRLAELRLPATLADAIELARTERVGWTTDQPSTRAARGPGSARD